MDDKSYQYNERGCTVNKPCGRLKVFLKLYIAQYQPPLLIQYFTWISLHLLKISTLVSKHFLEAKSLLPIPNESSGF